MGLSRPEHPTPQFQRESWLNLNGVWEFELDQAMSGKERGLVESEHLKGSILVPFCPESKASGIGYTDFINAAWYKRRVKLPESWQIKGRRTLLHIGACDYQSEVFVNGQSAGIHIGGYVSFSFDITKYLNNDENIITVYAQDQLRTQTQASGKQSQNYSSQGCFYTRTTGIWQTVWLENVPFSYIASVQYSADIENKAILIEAICESAHGQVLEAQAFFNGESMGLTKAQITGRVAKLTLKLDELYLWGLSAPNLYDLKLTLSSPAGTDLVCSYYGLRDIAYTDGKFLLNGKPVFQRLVLDQGYYPSGLYTAPSETELLADIIRSKAMGFNGARLHQKVFEPRFLYYCDRTGYIVWGEHASWGLDLSKPEAWQGFLPEWLEVLQRDVNHPCIVCWCPLNETSDRQNPHFVKMLADLTRAFDPSRPYVDASGWTHQGTLTDIMDMHDYEQDPQTLKDKLAPLTEGKPIQMPYSIKGHPTFVSEYGGILWNLSGSSGWGYGEHVKSEEEFIARYKGLTEALLNNSAITGFCYTQLTDVEQEQNGLYTYDRQPKFDPQLIASINTQPAAIEKTEE